MNRAILSKQANEEMINELKNDTQTLSSFLQNQNDGTIVYALEKLGRLENGYSREPLLNLLYPKEIGLQKKLKECKLLLTANTERINANKSFKSFIYFAFISG